MHVAFMRFREKPERHDVQLVVEIQVLQPGGQGSTNLELFSKKPISGIHRCVAGYRTLKSGEAQERQLPVDRQVRQS